MATAGETSQTADVVVTDDEDAMLLSQRYPHARVVAVGEMTDGFTYACEAETAVLCEYLKNTAVPRDYFEEIAEYVDKATRFLENYPPTKEHAERVKREIAIAEENDRISGVLFSLHREVAEGPRAAKEPPEQDGAAVNWFVLTAALAGGGFTALLVWALVMVNLKPKKNDQHEHIKEESE